MLDSSVIGRGIDPKSGQTKIGMSCSSAKHAALRNNSLDDSGWGYFVRAKRHVYQLTVVSDGKRPGVIIVSVGGVDHKKEVAKAKRQLKHNRKYSDVFIENDNSYEQRLYEANNKKL